MGRREKKGRVRREGRGRKRTAAERGARGRERDDVARAHGANSSNCPDLEGCKCPKFFTCRLPFLSIFLPSVYQCRW